MPFILIHLEEGKTEEQKLAVCRVVTADLSRNFRIPEQAVRILFQEYSPSQVSYRGLLKSSPEYRADKDGMLATNPHAQLVMPLVILYTEVGKSEEQFRLAAKDITTAVSAHLEIPEQAVRIIFQELEKSRIASGGLMESSPEYKKRLAEATTKHQQTKH